MGMTEVQQPSSKLAKTEVNREAFRAPPRSWITDFMHRGMPERGMSIASKRLGHSHITITASAYDGQVHKLPAVKFLGADGKGRAYGANADGGILEHETFRLIT